MYGFPRVLLNRYFIGQDLMRVSKVISTAQNCCQETVEFSHDTLSFDDMQEYAGYQ